MTAIDPKYLVSPVLSSNTLDIAGPDKELSIYFHDASGFAMKVADLACEQLGMMESEDAPAGTVGGQKRIGRRGGRHG